MIITILCGYPSPFRVFYWLKACMNRLKKEWMRPVKVIYCISVRMRCNGYITWEVLNIAKKNCLAFFARWHRVPVIMKLMRENFDLASVRLVRNLFAMRHPLLFPSEMFLRCIFYIILRNSKVKRCKLMYEG